MAMILTNYLKISVFTREIFEMIKYSLIAFSVLTALQVSAQDQSASNPQLEVIEVTAQRKSESIQDAALPIDAISQDELKKEGVSSSSSLNKVSPAISVVSGGGSNNVYFVRGVGNFAVNAYTDPALAFNVDGVYIGRPSATTGSFLDLLRVEVLKGPQGTLYGRNATAGAVNVIPAKPILGENSGYVTAGIGNFGAWEASGAVNIDLGSDWAARLAAARVKNDGYNDDGTASTDDTAFRGQIYGELSSDVNMRLSIDYSTSNGSGSAPTYLGNYDFPLAGVSDNPNNIPGYNFSPAPDDVASAFSGPYTDAAKAYYASLTTTPAFTDGEPQLPSFIDNSYFGISGEINIATDLGDWVIIPAYRKANLDLNFLGPGFKAVLNNENHEQFSLETRLANSVGPVNWILGGFYFDESIDAKLSFNQQSIQSTQVINESKINSKALFARATYNLSEDFRLVGGLRWSDDEKSMDGVANVLLNLCIRDIEVYPGGPVIPNCQGAPVIPAGLTLEETLAQIDPADLPAGAPGIGTGPVPFGQIPLFPDAPPGLTSSLLFINPTVVDRTRNESEVTYRFAAEYDLADGNLLYASYETGYRSGGFSLTTGREEYEPEYIDAYTIGSKNFLMDGQVKLNLELFYWDYEDQQASHLGLDETGNSALITENIGQSNIQGAEVELMYAMTLETTLRGTFQYLDNKIKQYSYEQLTPDPDVLVVTGCAQTMIEIVENGAVWEVDCSDQEGRNSPKLSVNLGLDHTFEIGDIYGELSLDARYRDDRWVGFDYLPVQRTEAVTTFDAGLELASSDDTWSVNFYVRNITDEEVKSITQTLGGMSNLISTVYEPPRTFGARFNYFFY